jgi:CPA2 family monovalent cation:H+ antiporter-2
MDLSDIEMLKDMAVIFVLAIIILLLCYRLKIPAIIGFLLTGIIVGPYGLGIFKAVNEAEFLADIGVILLLFTIGIEFSFRSLLQLKRSFFLGGSLQVGLTFTSTTIIAYYLGLPVNTSIFIGFLLSLSSTAIVLRLLQERDEIESPHGRTSVGILIFQDILAVPMMLLIPFLAGTDAGMGDSIFVLVAKIIGIILIVAIGTIWVVPAILFRITRTKSNELFMLTIVAICLGMAWLTSSVGLSLALGAFLAGLIISESEYSQQALGGILPFRDVFTSFFFISIGMLMDVGFVASHPWIIFLAVIAALFLKTFMGGLATLLMGYPIRTALLVGLALSQVGEFSFILSNIGLNYGMLDNDLYQAFLATSILTMAATPFVLKFSPGIAEFICKLPLPESIIADSCPMPVKKDELNDHLIIIGYGLNGRNVAKAASATGIKYIILEMNPETVKAEKAKGEPIHYGDATFKEVLHHANIEKARVAVIAISDPVATRRIVDNCKKMNPNIHIIVRTRFLREMKPLYESGANEVIPEEFETSVEIFARVLKKYLVPAEEIESMIAELRSESYEMLRGVSKESKYLSEMGLLLSDVELLTVRVRKGSFMDGKTIAQAELRKKHGVTILTIRRNSQNIYNPEASTGLLAGDVVIIYGKPTDIAEAMHLFQGKK